MDATQFYTSKNLTKYQNDGKLLECKKCLTMMVDNWNPDTFMPILKELDVPYIKEKWDELLERYAQDPTKKVTGTTILGRYLSIMKLNQWNKYTFEDTEKLAEEARQHAAETMRDAGMAEDEIEEELSKDHGPQRPEYVEPEEAVSPELEAAKTRLIEQEKADAEILDKLGEEDVLYLRLKWGVAYRPSEWVRMEQLYEDMMASYDIQTAGHKDTLIKLCKTSLKMDQLIDMGDIEGFQKISKVYDALMKSGKFTALQNKENESELVDSVGEIVELCEKQGFIPRYYVDKPMDKVDRVLQDLQEYTASLVKEEINLGGMIEASLKQIQADMEKESDLSTDDDDEVNEDKLFEESETEELSTNDYQELYDLEEAAAMADEAELAEDGE